MIRGVRIKSEVTWTAVSDGSGGNRRRIKELDWREKMHKGDMGMVGCVLYLYWVRCEPEFEEYGRGTPLEREGARCMRFRQRLR